MMFACMRSCRNMGGGILVGLHAGGVFACMHVCVCLGGCMFLNERERERERESVCVCVCWKGTRGSLPPCEPCGGPACGWDKGVEANSSVGTLCQDSGGVRSDPEADLCFLLVDGHSDGGMGFLATEVVALVTGPKNRVLQMERTFLEIISRCSAVATQAREAVNLAKETGVCLRMLEPTYSLSLSPPLYVHTYLYMFVYLRMHIIGHVGGVVWGSP